MALAAPPTLDGPTVDRLARARCLSPVLGHITVRLASLIPGLRIASEALQCHRRRHPTDDPSPEAALPARPPANERSETPANTEDSCADGTLAGQVRSAIDDALARVQEVSRFTIELAELCGAEGQWLVAFALAPKVVRKFNDDFVQLSVNIDNLVQLLPDFSEPDEVALFVDQVSTQPGALSVTPPEVHEESNSSALCASSSPLGLHGGRAATLRMLLTPPLLDIQSDLDADRLGSLLSQSELKVAPELLQWLMPKSAQDGDVAGDTGGGSSPSAGSAEAKAKLLERLSGLGRGNKPAATLTRELEAAEQYCRVLDGTASSAGGAAWEARTGGAGRDALVSEAQASGGSTLHRWIRTEVSEPSDATAGYGYVAPGRIKNGIEARQSFVKMEEIPHEFLCPIAHDVMRDAVSTCDGHTYERRNIEAWLAEKSTSPITGLPLANKTLIPNHNLRKLILDSGILSRLEPDAEPCDGTNFCEDIVFEILVPGEVPSLTEALTLGAARVAAISQGAAGIATRRTRSSSELSRTGPGGTRIPYFGIRLQSGEYTLTASILIEQDVEIIGAGTSGTTLLFPADVAIEVRANCRFANLSMHRDCPWAGEATASDSEGVVLVERRGRRSTRFPLLDITQGSCRVEQCDLSNSLGTGIRVSGAHTSPIIRRNTIHDCRDTGVVFKDGADGTLAGNRLFNNSSVAVEIHARADPLLEDNDIFDGKQGGVFVYNRGKGHLRRNKIFRNALEGVEIKQGGRPLVEDNDIYDNLECGIFIHDAGEGRVIGNRIHSNSYAGIEIKDSASPEIRGNDIYSGRTSGMYIHSGGQGVIEGNSIHQNWLHGVYVRSRGCPHLMKNVIFRNDECGVFVTEHSHPIIEHNEVYSNGLAGVEVKEDSNPTIKLNRIHDGNTGGIFVLANGKGRITENKLYNNTLEGIEIKDGGDPTVIDNEIYDNHECGVFAHDRALGRIEDNRIYGNAYAGMEIKDMSNPLVKGNRIYRGRTSGIYVHSMGQGRVFENDIFENGLHGMMILSGGNPHLQNNKVHDNMEHGVVAHVGFHLDNSNRIFSNRARDVQTVKA